jgi:hypothetical protein
MIMKNTGFEVNIKLDYHDALALVRLIRSREDDLRKVTEDCPNYEVMHKLQLEVGVLKMRVADQIPSCTEADAKIAELSR